MSTQLAVETDHVVINPLTIDGTVQRIDAAVAAMVETVVGGIEDEISRAVRRRDVAAAVRGILATRDELDRATAGPVLVPGLIAMAIDGCRPDLIGLFRRLNPVAVAGRIDEVVDKILAEYLDKVRPAAGTEDGGEKKKRVGKSAAG